MLDAKLTRRAFLSLAATASLAACGGGGGSDAGSDAGADAGSDAGAGSDAAAGAAAGAKIIMITDVGGVHDQSFNQLSWAGLQRLQDEFGWEVSYIESKQEADYITNLDKAVDEEPSLIWGIGFAMADAINQVADQNPDVKFAAIECTNDIGVSNLTGVNFKSEESSFVVGYIAARMSKSGKVGFIGGVDSEIIQAFQNGYFAGVEYANKEQGTSVTYEGQMAESFADAAKGMSIAQKMIDAGADVVYHAAGLTGTGMIEACDEAGIYAIGVDMDQSYLAPNTVITSALKCVDEAIYKVSKELVNDEVPGGENMVLGAADGGVGIAETHDLLPEDVYEAALGLLELMKAGDIEVPSTADGLSDYIASL